MRWLLDNAEAAHRLESELESWRGTPWYHVASTPGRNLAVKGLKGDCVTIIAACYEACGFVEAVLIPAHPPMTGFAREDDEATTLSKILLDLVKRGVLAVAPRPLRFGDLLTFRYAGREHHLGVYATVPEMFWHCAGSRPGNARFGLGSLRDMTHRHAMRNAYRLVDRSTQDF